MWLVYRWCLPVILQGVELRSPACDHRIFPGASSIPAGSVRYLDFATSPAALSQGNFRDLAASVTHMAMLGPADRIDKDTVEFESGRLRTLWSGEKKNGLTLTGLLSEDPFATIDPFDRV